ncbi:MAG: glycosyltransferase [Candidatus Amesbacteria bacterium]|nr:glycosyltransferase [Candidatus Amesbacteria bacterium]
MLTPYLPYPPSIGGQLRSYHLIKRLSKNHEITLVCFTRDYNSAEQINHMKQYCKDVIIFQRDKTWTLPNILRTGFSWYPFLVMIYYSPEIKDKLQEIIDNGNFDLIHAETFYVLPFLPKTELPTVLVEQTIMSRVFRHYVDHEAKWWLWPFLLIDVAKISYWEKYYWQRADSLIAVSDEDAAIMKQRTFRTDVKVVPNGVGEDFDLIKPILHYNHKILYQGNYKWMQNWEAAHILATKTFPIIKKAIPDAQLIINGQFPTHDLKKLASRDILIQEHADADSNAVVKAYSGAGILVAPIYGPGGTRLKILAAMKSMLPVVTTPLGAEGYGAVDGESIVVGKTPEDIAHKTINVLKDKKLYTKIAKSARIIADKHFSWDPIAKKLESIYEEIIKK